MARNRKSQSAAIRFGPALKAFVLCLVIGGSGVGYVWQKGQISQLARQIKDRETHLKRLKDDNENLRKDLARMRSPLYLDAKIKDLGLGLVAPPPSQVMRLNEPVEETQKPEKDVRYAAQNGAAPLAMKR